MKEYKIVLGGYEFPYYYLKSISELIHGILQNNYYQNYIIVYDNKLPQGNITALAEGLSKVSEAVVLPWATCEHNKDIHHISILAETLLHMGISRKTCLIAAGGGTLGNIAGMTAGLLFRGIDFLHIPSTVISCADSVLSMKQAVNTKESKNMLGLYYPPKAVYTCFAMLTTLSEREVCSGYVEFVKNLITIIPNEINNFLNRSFNGINFSHKQIQDIIQLSIAAKNEILNQDPREKRKGILLEYGHTVGHALEILTCGQINHGESVAFGMLAAGRISRGMGHFSDSSIKLQQKLLCKIHSIRYLNDKQTLLETIDKAKLQKLLLNDNKRGYISCRPDEVGMVVMEDFGKPLKTDGVCMTAVKVNRILSAVTEAAAEIKLL